MEEIEKQGPSGIGGWLLVLVIQLAIGSLVSVWLICTDIMTSETQYPVLLTVDTWSTYKSITWCLCAIFLALRCYCIWDLFNGKTWATVRRTIVILWVTAPIWVLLLSVLIPTIIFGDSWTIDERVPKWIIGCTITATIWTLYFLKSVRVRNTYGGNDTSHAPIKTTQPSKGIKVEPLSRSPKSEEVPYMKTIKKENKLQPLKRRNFIRNVLLAFASFALNIFFFSFFYKSIDNLYVERCTEVLCLMILCAIIVLPVFWLVKLRIKKWPSFAIYIGTISILCPLMYLLAAHGDRYFRETSVNREAREAEPAQTVCSAQRSTGYQYQEQYNNPPENKLFVDKSTQFGSPLIMEAQKLLTDLGYDTGPITGEYNEQTMAAVMFFESDHNIAADGRLDDFLLNDIRYHASLARSKMKEVKPTQHRSAKPKQQIKHKKKHKKKQLSDTFTKGSPKQFVIKLQGEPDSRTPHHTYEVWHYGYSSVKVSLKDHKVISWCNSSGNLKVSSAKPKQKKQRRPLNTFTQGSPRQLVIKLQDCYPDSVTLHPTYEILHYGHSFVKVSLKDLKVLSWCNTSGNLKVK